MKLVTLALAASLTTTSALAVCIPGTVNDGVALRVSRGGNVAEFRYNDLRFGSDGLREEQLRGALQELVDNREVRERMSSDDPDRYENPDLPTAFWSDKDGNPVESILDATHVTFRCVLVADVVWNGVDFVVQWQGVN